MPNPPERMAALLEAYLAADYQWQRDGRWFPLAIGEQACELECTFPNATQFGVMSAWNPRSEPQPAKVNLEADHALQAALESSGCVCRPAFGSARNRSWKEPGRLVVDLRSHECDTLARRFGQLGTLWWRRGEPVRLRMYDYPAGADEHAFVDWIK